MAIDTSLALSRITRRTIVALCLAAIILAGFHFAEAQQPAKIPRIGYVSGTGFVINLKTAKQIGLNIPQSVLFRADKVIQ